MDLLITGANGFLGAQIATQWLCSDARARIGCLVRGADAETARHRLHDALRQAALDQAVQVDVADLLERTQVIHGDLGDADWIETARDWLSGPTELFHCAADLSFRDADRARVRKVNVEGTRALLAALPQMHQIVAFNYISTAYVAGDRQGEIREDERYRPRTFNNPYEESKWDAETLVREVCVDARLPWRIFRPSIIIAHSVTHRMSAQSGFYQVFETLLQFGRRKESSGAEQILLPVPHGTTLDLIPVDVVVEEILALIALGVASTNQTFHITSEAPLSLAEVLRELSPLSGVPLAAGGVLCRTSAAATLVSRRLRYYMPYFSFVRRFDRRNSQHGADLHRFRMDVDQLRGFIQSFMTSRAQPTSRMA